MSKLNLYLSKNEMQIKNLLVHLGVVFLGATLVILALAILGMVTSFVMLAVGYEGLYLKRVIEEAMLAWHCFVFFMGVDLVIFSVGKWLARRKYDCGIVP